MDRLLLEVLAFLQQLLSSLMLMVESIFLVLLERGQLTRLIRQLISLLRYEIEMKLLIINNLVTVLGPMLIASRSVCYIQL